MYKSFMIEYQQLGHMEQFQDGNKYDKYYLPHHGVLKASSTTTKLRVVFDASAKSSTGVSLNDILMVGPTVQPSLVNILIRFRQHEFVLCGDIEKMYRQVWVDHTDRQYQNILWRINPRHQPGTFQLKTVTYGTASAAFLATRSIREVGISLKQSHPEAANTILNDMYVDDMLTGSSTIAKMNELRAQISIAFERHGFKMRKFLTNNDHLRSLIHDCGVREIKEIGEQTDISKVLGLHWDSYEDTFKFSVKLPERSSHTKRTLLSDASRNFDPLGWLAPIIIRVKILFQTLWMQNLDWDDELPQRILKTWIAIRNDLCNTTEVRVSRWAQAVDAISLVGFSDASEQAYAAVIYALVNTSEGHKSNLIMAKTRVAPVKQVSLPRLELMGALLLASSMKLVEKAITIKKVNISLYTDSQVVLDWLSAHPRRWTTFVAKRTSAILDLYNRTHWWHVSSKCNPADVASRGVATSELINNNLWWYGPQWLQNDNQPKPIQSIKTKSHNLTSEEVRPSQIDTFTISIPKTNHFFEVFLSRYSSFQRTVKILSLVRRFIKNLRTKKRQAEVNTEEIQAAETILVRYIQNSVWPIEMEALKKNSALLRSSNLTSLHPFIDENDIMRVGGRIQKSIASFETKHPVILPTNHHVVKCIVRDAHILYNHPGISLLTSIIRRKFWIIKAKAVSRFVVNKCVKCIRHNPKIEQQLMGNLPIERVRYIHPFYNVGVDYCEPFKVHPIRRRGQIPIKVYVCIFVCLGTKAVHIEVVGNLTTESFMGAFTRFTARRGNCHTMYSDNGTNFVGANNHLQELFKFLRMRSSDIATALLQHRINWRFIPPGAPHMGGIWEAAVKQAKIHLGRVVGQSILTLEEFSTLLTKIEAIMNSRPIAVSQGEDIDCITPAHFLIGRPYTDMAEEPISESNVSPLARWRLVKQMHQHFWNRWHREYLVILQKRTKWVKEYKNIEVGDVVLIGEKDLPSTCWSLGKITKIIPGSDGKVRIVDIRIANTNKIIQRPVHKLCKLPIHEMNQLIHGRRNVDVDKQ